LTGQMESIFVDFVAGTASRGMDDVPLVFVATGGFPWRMLYAIPGDPDRIVTEDDNPLSVPSDGFLGIARVVDQSMPTRAGGKNTGTTIPVGLSSGFANGPGGSVDIRAALAPRTDLSALINTDEGAFAKGVGSRDVALIYTFCHGQFRPGEGGATVQELTLTNPFNPLLLKRRIKDQIGELPTASIAFINACQGGVSDATGPTTTFLTTLRECGAGALIGPLIDMPTVFGGRFGARILALLADPTVPTLGSALLKATREFMDQHRNPLGLAYAATNGRNASLPAQ